MDIQVGDVVWWIVSGVSVSGIVLTIRGIIAWVTDDEGVPIDVDISKIVKVRRSK